jgi:hypothetical protein
MKQGVFPLAQLFKLVYCAKEVNALAISDVNVHLLELQFSRRDRVRGHI